MWRIDRWLAITARISELDMRLIATRLSVRMLMIRRITIGIGRLRRPIAWIVVRWSIHDGKNSRSEELDK